MIRVTHYEANAHYTSTGSTSHGKYPFLPEHFKEAKVEFNPEGVEYLVARQLCDKWTRRGKYTSIRYSYYTLTADDFRYYSQKS